jgi:hypothetical protein
VATFQLGGLPQAGTLDGPRRGLRPPRPAGHRPGPLQPSGQGARPLSLLAPLPRLGLAWPARRPLPRARCRDRFLLASCLEPGRSRRGLVFPLVLPRRRLRLQSPRPARSHGATPSVLLLSPANKNDLPFADPPLWLGHLFFALPSHVVRAAGASWGKELVHVIVTRSGTPPVIPCHRPTQPLARVRHRVDWPRRDLARAVGVPLGPCFVAAVQLQWPRHPIAPELGCGSPPDHPDLLRHPRRRTPRRRPRPARPSSLAHPSPRPLPPGRAGTMIYAAVSLSSYALTNRVISARTV